MQRILHAISGLALFLPGAGAAQQAHRGGSSDSDRQGQGGHQGSRSSANQHANQQTEHRPGARPATFHRYNTANYQYPRDYGYKRWQTGLLLPNVFLSSPYLWSNSAALGLGSAPRGFVWVRYGRPNERWTSPRFRTVPLLPATTAV